MLETTEGLGRNHGRRPHLLDHLAQLMLSVERSDRGAHRADVPDGEAEQVGLPPVRRLPTYNGTWPNSGPTQPRRGMLDEIQQLAVRHLHARLGDRRARTPQPGGTFDR